MRIFVERKTKSNMILPKITQAQAKAIFDSLINQVSPLTPIEKEFIKHYKKIFPTPLNGDALGFEFLNGKVRQINMDKFGEDYRNKWVKVKHNTKGSYFFSSYIGKRIYF